jgi:tetraacyldisaccharide 4'-kinase
MGSGRSIILYPFSIIWRLITDFRNFLYNSKLLKSFEFEVPVICIGNITVGGTGKTPHSEYLIELLRKKFNIALLSRGYKRKSKGFHFAVPGSGIADIGDEPLQISRKFPDITVAVDGDRVRGVKKILAEKPETEVIILDDGYQHRRITPGLSILLSDFVTPISRDHLLPYGNLRESAGNIDRADVILITKTPAYLSDKEQGVSESGLGRKSWQTVFFTTLRYRDPVPVFDKNASESLTFNLPECGILLITGIANPKPLYDHIRKSCKEIIHLPFRDHHNFTRRDIEKINNARNRLVTEKKYVFTTEKDAVRLRELSEINEPLLSALYYIPVEIRFLNDKEEEFNNLIIDYVGKNKRND